MKQRFVFLLFFATIGFAQTSADVARQVAAKVLAQIPSHSAIALEFENRSSAPAVDVDELRHAFEDAVKEGGMTISDGSETRLHAYVSENPAGYLLIAQSGTITAMATWPRAVQPAKEFRMAIKRDIIKEQSDPILDFELAGDGATRLLLETDRVVQSTKGQPDRIALFPALRLRDPRGRLTGSIVEIGSATCNLSRSPDLKATCDTGARVPGSLVADRNYYDDPKFGNYYSTARVGNVVLAAGLDGNTRMFTQQGEPAIIPGWGSDITSLVSNCGAKEQVIATSPATAGTQDYLQAFEISGNTVNAVSEPLVVPGIVTALWPADNRAEARIVVHNKRTGTYEASRVSISCSQ